MIKLEPKPLLYPSPLKELIEARRGCCEASPEAIGAQFIAAAGCFLGRTSVLNVGETPHRANEFVLAVGPTGQGKGDAKHYALAAFEEADPLWFAHNVRGGLSSGEGLIHNVRDEEVRGQDRKGRNIVIPGVRDKRFLLDEPEFTAVLKVITRDGNTLSNVLREAFDGKEVLATLTKTSPTKATGAHVGLIGHTTRADLRRYLADLDCRNGLVNRFLFVVTKRVEAIPRPSPMPANVRHEVAVALRSARAHAVQTPVVSWSEEAGNAWDRLYAKIRDPQPGLLGDITARGAAHVCRLALIFALLDKKQFIEERHLRAATSWWDVSLASARAIFGDRTGNSDADRILEELPRPGDYASLTELRERRFANKISAGRLADAIDLLISMKEIKTEERRSGGRPAKIITRLERAAADAA